MNLNRKKWMQFRRRLAQIIEVGAADDFVSRGYDIFSTIVLLTNVSVTVLYTFDKMELYYGELLLLLEAITIACFAVDYVFRLISAHFLYPNLTEYRALKRYVLSFTGIVDLFSFVPYYLPFFFPAGASVFRMFRASGSSGCSRSMPTMTL